MNERLAIAIAGAGVFGATAALELARRGHSVTLLDPGPLPHPDAASTDISKIVRADYGDDELYTELGEQAIQGWRGWNASWQEPLFHETGFVVLTAGSLEQPSFEGESWRTLGRRGHALERLDRAAIAARFPRFAAGRFRDGYLSPSGGWVESGRVVTRLLEDARAAGVTLREGLAFTGLHEQCGRVAGIVTDRARIEADRVVLCAGSWTPLLVPELADRIAAVGQPVLCFEPEHAERFAPPELVPWAADIATTGFYGFCANRDGIVKVANHGAGTPLDPRAAGERRVPAGTEQRFREFLAGAIPELARAPLVASRLCPYSDTFDGDFFIDRHPERPGLTVAAGGSGHAFKFAPMLGAIIADVVEERPNRFAARFAWRSRGARKTERARFDG